MGLYSSPKPPDPYQTSNAQLNYELGASQASGIINNPNTYDPYGQTEYTVSGYETITTPDGKQIQVPRYNKTTSLTEAGQGLQDKQNVLSDQLFDVAKGSTGTSSTTGQPDYQYGYDAGQLRTDFRTPEQSLGFTGINDQRLQTEVGSQAFNPTYTGKDLATSYAPADGFSADRRRVEEAMMSRANELLGTQRASEVAGLAAMGLAPGTEKYGRVSDQFERSANDLAMQAILAGGGEQSRLLGEARSAAGFQNQAMGQGFDMDMGLTGAENARLMGDAQFKNSALQTQQMLDASLTEMENARRSGDSAAYNAALEAYNNAQLAQTQLSRDQANFANSVRNASVSETEAIKNADINRLVAALSGAQVQNPAIPNYFTQGIQAPDYSGLVQSNYAQEVAASNAKMSAITGLAGSALGAAGSMFKL